MTVATTRAMDFWRGQQTLPPSLGVAADERLWRGMWPRSLSIWLVAVYLALFIIRPWERLEPWMAEIRFERVYALVMIVGVMLTRGIRVRVDPISVAVYLFFFAVCLSALCAWDPALSLHGDGYGLYGYATVVVMFLMLTSATRTLYELLFMVACYIVAMGLYLAKNLWEFFLHGNGQYADGMIRLQGVDATYGHPNDLAVSIVVSLPMAFFLYTSRAEFCSSWPSGTRRAFGFGLLAYAILALLSIIFTYSRTGVVSSLIFLVLIVFRQGSIIRQCKRLLAGLLLIAVVWLVVPEDIRSRIESIWDPEAARATYHTSAMGRIDGFWVGVEMLRHFPTTGVGIGNFITYRELFVDGVALESHNLYGQVLGQTGLIGGATFTLMVWLVLRGAKRIRGLASRRLDDASMQCLANFSLAVRETVVLLLFTGLFAHTAYRFNWIWIAAFTALAVRFAIWRFEECEWRDESFSTPDCRG